MDDYTFFRNLVFNISSSLELSESFRATYDFLANELPIIGITLHRFDPRLRSIHLDFLVSEKHFYELDTLIPLSERDIDIISENESRQLLINMPQCPSISVASKINKAISEYIPPENRAFLVAILAVGKEVVGHIGLIGKTVGCFKSEHEHKMELMRAPISLAMVNMLQHKRAKELQQRLDEHRQLLAGEVNLLKDSVIVGKQGGLRATMEMVEQLVGKETPALILGETGTGKELIADAIQRISPRNNAPYVKVNCGAIPETLMDSELFGYQKGAFTGALSNKAGRFEQAEGGTLFLDEVGELSFQAQVRLLRVLQNGIIERVGGNRSINVNVRIIAATNRPLEIMLQDGTFREDLFYRLNVFPITIPPLRERPEDIPLLARRFVHDFSKQMKLSGDIHLDGKSMSKLQKYSWPGNVRELKNLVERALTLNPHGPLNLAQYLPSDPERPAPDKVKDSYLKNLIREQIEEVLSTERPVASINIKQQGSAENKTIPRSLDEVTSEHIRGVLDYCRGKINGPGGAAEILIINPSTLRKRMKKLNIPFGFGGKK